MKIKRKFSAPTPVEDQIRWKVVPAQLDRKTGLTGDVEVPETWSQNAANILADLYLRKAGIPAETRTRLVKDGGGMLPFHGGDVAPRWLFPSVPTEGTTFGAETSVKQTFHRLAGAWTYHGWCAGHLTTDEDAQAFYDECYMMLALQIMAPNSPQWFNTGLWWAYGITGGDTGMWRVDPDDHRITDDGWPIAARVLNSYEYPQPHACFLTPTADDLVNEGGIMDTWGREARIFKHGSGSGVNPSVWRGKNEPLSGGGVASGLMGWLRIGDSAAGAISSGGTTRRAAKMVCLDDDHPELIEFIDWKLREEGKAAAMDVGSQLLRNYQSGARYEGIDIPRPMLDRLENGFEPEPLPAAWESEAMRTIDGQNSNNSIRATDRLILAIDHDEPWNLTARTSGETVKSVPAKELWDKICRAAWACADPGLIFHDTVNAWNTCAADGVIRTTNPCCEFHHLDGSACNLASLRLTAFLREDGEFDVAAYEHAARLTTIVLDISVTMASFPAREFAEGAYNYRTLGLGYMDLGGLLMRIALPYDSDAGRALAAALTAIMTGIAYLTSAEMAGDTRLGPFPRYAANREPTLAVMEKHRDATRVVPMPTEIGARAQAVWDIVILQGSISGFRNAQTTLIAPTGTISFVTDCDTSGIEPDYALVKHKQLAGGGTMKIVNRAVPTALRRLGYDDASVRGMVSGIEDGRPIDEFGLLERDRRIFDCVAELEPMAHVKMLAAIQPFLSGAASKTVNLPNDATVEDVSRVYHEAHRLGVKAIALYRDGSKLTQPLAAAKPRKEVVSPEQGQQPERLNKTTPPVTGAFARGRREPLPSRRKGETQKARVGGQTVYWRTGEYPDGRLGEIFIDLAGAGSTLDGFANCLAKIASIALQFGAPVSEVVDALLGIRFEPAGHVELHDRIKWCTSIVDLAARDLAITYDGREDLANVVRAVAIDSNAIVALDKRAIAVAEASGRTTGETCDRCGGLLVQTGTCKTCSDCGVPVGGCG